MKSKVFFVFIFLFFVLLQSCYSQPITTPTSTLTLLPNSTTTKISTHTPSATLSPREITQTASYPTFIISKQTQEHYMFTSVPSTLEARNVKCKDGFALELWSEVVRMSNDEWTIFTCSPSNVKDWQTPETFDFGARYTQLIKTDFSRTWTIQHNEFDYSVIDRLDALLAPFRWTADGKYLYFSPQYYPGGSGGYTTNALRTSINDLYRINLETGEFELVLQKKYFNALSMSPDNKFLVYSHWDEPEIIYLRNLESEGEIKVELNEDIIASGRFLWNPDSTRIVFITAHGEKNPPSGDDTSSTSIFILTIKNMHVQKILSKDTRIFVFSDGCNRNNNSLWIDENTICLYTLSSNWNDYFSINIKTGLVLHVRPFLDPTPTLTPTP